jgi:hypothetical protein
MMIYQFLKKVMNYIAKELLVISAQLYIKIKENILVWVIFTTLH